jgi:hypothetical protein
MEPTKEQKAEHTPGPWKVAEWSCNAPTTVMAGSVVIAETAGCGRHSDECLADARLIAAAPELYEFVQEVAGDGLDRVSPGLKAKAKVIISAITKAGAQ